MLANLLMQSLRRYLGSQRPIKAHYAAVVVRMILLPLSKSKGRQPGTKPGFVFLFATASGTKGNRWTPCGVHESPTSGRLTAPVLRKCDPLVHRGAWLISQGGWIANRRCPGQCRITSRIDIHDTGHFFHDGALQIDSPL